MDATSFYVCKLILYRNQSCLNKSSAFILVGQNLPNNLNLIGGIWISTNQEPEIQIPLESWYVLTEICTLLLFRLLWFFLLSMRVWHRRKQSILLHCALHRYLHILPSGPIEYLSKSKEACSQVGLKLLEGTSNGHLQGLQSPGVCLNGLP